MREPKSNVPPLARGRGMPSHKIKTPTEDRRYVCSLLYKLINKHSLYLISIRNCF